MNAGLVLVSALYLLGWDGYHLPDPRVTPGETVAITKEELCATKWGKDVRHVTQAMKVEVCSRYGVPGSCPGPRYELDHLVPRELGGADTVKNVWPQPIKEARLKDTLENFLHRAVCSDFMRLEDAQKAIREDWSEAYRVMKDQR